MHAVAERPPANADFDLYPPRAISCDQQRWPHADMPRVIHRYTVIRKVRSECKNVGDRADAEQLSRQLLLFTSKRPAGEISNSNKQVLLQEKKMAGIKCVFVADL